MVRTGAPANGGTLEAFSIWMLAMYGISLAVVLACLVSFGDAAFDALGDGTTFSFSEVSA